MPQSILETTRARDAGNLSPLVLGFCNGRSAGETLELSACKSYLGAGHQTTISPQRVARPGTVHGVILRGPSRTVIRAWSDHIRLNGHRFDDAPLNIGDRLQLGAVELEVLESSAPQQLDNWRKRLQAITDSQHQPADDAERQARETERARRAAAIERAEFDLQQQREQDKQFTAELDRRRRLIDELATEICAREHAADRRQAANDQLRIELDRQAVALDQQQAAQALEQASAALALQARIDEWEARQAAEAALQTAQLAAIETSAAQVREREQAVTALQRSLETHRWQQQERQDDEQQRQRELAHLQSELAAARESLEQAQQQRSEVESRLTEQAQRNERAAAEHASERESLTARIAELTAEVHRVATQRAELETNQLAAAMDNQEAQSAWETRRQEWEATLARREQELNAAVESSATAQRRFDEALERFAAERAEHAANVAQLENDRRIQDRECGEFKALQQQQQARHREQEQALFARQAALDAAREELDATKTQLEAARTELDRERAELEQSRRELTAAQAELASKSAEVDRVAQQQAIDSQHDEFLRAEIEDQRSILAAQAADLKAREAALVEQQLALDEREAQLATGTEEPAADAVTVEQSSPAAPQSTEEVFRRLQSLGLLAIPGEEEPTETSAADTSDATPAAETAEPPAIAMDEPQLATAPVSAPTTASVHEDEDDELAIERYMSQLLGRSREKQGTQAATWQPASQATKPAPVVAPVVEAPPAAAVDALTVPAVPRESARRAPLPESDLTAMRELANQSARAALETHSRELLLNELCTKALICLSFTVATIFLFSATGQLGAIGLYSALACAVGVIFSGVKLGIVARDYVRETQPLPAAEPSAEDVVDDVAEVATDTELSNDPDDPDLMTLIPRVVAADSHSALATAAQEAE